MDENPRTRDPAIATRYVDFLQCPSHTAPLFIPRLSQADIGPEIDVEDIPTLTAIWNPPPRHEQYLESPSQYLEYPPSVRKVLRVHGRRASTRSAPYHVPPETGRSVARPSRYTGIQVAEDRASPRIAYRWGRIPVPEYPHSTHGICTEREDPQSPYNGNRIQCHARPTACAGKMTRPGVIRS